MPVAGVKTCPQGASPYLHNSLETHPNYLVQAEVYTMNSFIFDPIQEPLKVSLGMKYIIPAAEWIMGKGTDPVLAIYGNSAWEAAFSILYLLDTKNILRTEKWAKQNIEMNKREELIELIDYKVIATVDWLINHCETEFDHSTSQVLTNWDNITWDTSVVLRSFLAVLTHYGIDGLTNYQRIEELCSSSLTWLIKAVNKWRATPYTAGPQDVAEILILITKLADSSPKLYKQVVENSDWHGHEDELTWEVTELVIKSRSEARQFPISAGLEEQTIALWWGEFFGTAEVLEALAEFYQFQIGREQSLNPHQKLILDATKETLVKAVLYFDYTQKDGTWGSAITDTARVAMTYVQLTSTLSFLRPNPFVAFKSLRWLCAETQVAKDGSFLHSLFLTIYYALAVMSYYKNWRLVGQPVIEVYDIALHEAAPAFNTYAMNSSPFVRL